MRYKLVASARRYMNYSAIDGPELFFNKSWHARIKPYGGRSSYWGMVFERFVPNSSGWFTWFSRFLRAPAHSHILVYSAYDRQKGLYCGVCPVTWLPDKAAFSEDVQIMDMIARQHDAVHRSEFVGKHLFFNAEMPSECGSTAWLSISCSLAQDVYYRTATVVVTIRRPDEDRGLCPKPLARSLALLHVDLPLSKDLKSAGFDPERFNIAVVGTNNTGKSTYANLLMFNHRTSPDLLAKQINDPTLSENVTCLLPFKAVAGLGTTNEMLKDGRCKRDLDMWFHNATLWDMPGLDLSHQGVENYLRMSSLNHFGAVLLVCEKQLSLDDFTLISCLQRASVAGKGRPNGVPFFIIRSKMDDVFIDDFERWCQAGNPPHTWCLQWASNSDRIRTEMLKDLDAANRKLSDADAHASLSAGISFSRQRFRFSGFAGRLSTIQSGGKPMFLIPAHRLESIFAQEMNRMRKALLDLSTDNLGHKPASAKCAFKELIVASAKMPKDVPVPKPFVLLQVTIKNNLSDLEVVEGQVREGADKHGLKWGDQLLEVPVGVRYTEDVGLGQLKMPFRILIQRNLKKVAVRKGFNDSLYLRKWVTDYAFEYDAYKEATLELISWHAEQEGGLPKQAISHMHDQLLVFHKPEAQTPSEIAAADWTNLAQLEFEGQEYGELCSMIARAVREDVEPAIGYAVTFLLALRGQIVQPRGQASGWQAPLRYEAPLRAPNAAFPKEMHRGTSMPMEAVNFFKEGTKYRAPMPLATSKLEDIAIQFMWRSHARSVGGEPVHFIVDVSQRPLHVSFIESVVPEEQEFLFMPYSCFQVLGKEKAGSVWRIKVKAYKDNVPSAADAETHDSEAWPLAPWH